MKYAIIENDKIANIVVATPEFAEKQNWIPVPQGAGIGFIKDGDSWVEPPPDLEKLAKSAREQRNNLLEESDTILLPDRWIILSEEKQVEWATYRQALRDIPEQENFPLDVVWPIKPE